MVLTRHQLGLYAEVNGLLMRKLAPGEDVLEGDWFEAEPGQWVELEMTSELVDHTVSDANADKFFRIEAD